MRYDLEQLTAIAARRQTFCDVERYPTHARGPRNAEGRSRSIRKGKLRLTSNEQRLLLFGADDSWTCSLLVQSTRELQTRPTHMREEHTSPNAGAFHSAHVLLGCERRSRMYDFWLGVLASLAVLIITLAYRSHIRSDIHGMSSLHKGHF